MASKKSESVEFPIPPGFRLLRTLQSHAGAGLINSVAWAPDGYTLASGSADKTIRLWDSRVGKEVHIIEGHTGTVDAISFSLKSPLLASRSDDGTIRIWHTGTWKEVATLKTGSINILLGNLAFHPTTSMLAAPDRSSESINIWGFDPALLLGALATLPFEAL